MTIAACYLSTEGVVLGADSTSTLFVPGPGNTPGSEHYYNFAQKLFEFGEHATVGITTWGLGSLGEVSYRTLVAEVADAAASNSLSTLGEVAELWANTFWQKYASTFGQYLNRASELQQKSNRTPDEENERLRLWLTLSGGFCIGGRWAGVRTPSAFEIPFNPTMTDASAPQPIAPGFTKFWGCPNLVGRLLYGIDEGLFSAIFSSGKWTGTQDELFDLVRQSVLSQPVDLPLREAIDWVFASIYTTIKGMKFSHLAPVCGGPIEIAVITSDRPFRWVRHKSMGEAIS